MMMKIMRMIAGLKLFFCVGLLGGSVMGSPATCESTKKRLVSENDGTEERKCLNFQTIS